MAVRGRYLIALWLLFSLAILAWVIERQTSGVVTATRLSEVRAERSALDASQAELFGRIREARSREKLIPRAESLGLRLPADSELVIVKVPVAERF